MTINAIISAILALLTLPISLSGATGGERTDSAVDDRVEIQRLERETLKAAMAADLAALDRLWGDDFEFTVPNGLTVPKAAYLAMLKSGAVKYEVLEQESLQVRVFGESATASGRFRVKGQANGEVLDGIDHALTVYVKRDGRWQQVAMLATRVATFNQR
jgi:ketosteroid isomerase-like protein